MANELAKAKTSLTVYLSKDAVKNQINSVVGGKNGSRFISAIISAVQSNPALQECTNQSIVSAALLGEGLNLSPSPQLGQYYLVPYGKKTVSIDSQTGEQTFMEIKQAQFQMGYKGYIQLAIRSGYYKKITVLPIKEGELIKFDPLNEEIEVKLIDDEEDREKAKTVGYYAMFEYLNGFRKAIYWSMEKMLKHADKYSQAFSKDGYTKKQKNKNGNWEEIKIVSYEDYLAGKYDKKDEWRYSSFWYKNFDEMANKTMIRQLISKWGIMSIELQNALEADMSVTNEDGTKEYVDNEADIVSDTSYSEVKDPFEGRGKEEGNPADGQQELNLGGGADEVK